ncbi:dipeptidase [Acidisoma cellulosilytica]|uniref:Dipeptidase n=1 Tax=Acidisoma cellulosilyticum TaxID=2802395 RepID=A0A964E507_9PROT|nr:dipeptidase [Acidisoma cellulosilyticum]MCB8881999.1 dipeptidase [Acidisoma cellulosilyticum]
MNAPTQTEQQLHDALLTIDTHIDIPWPPGASPFEDGPRRVDLPKMRRGGLGAGCFAAYIPQGKNDEAGFQAAYERATAMLRAIHEMGEDNGDATRLPGRIATTVAEIETARADGAPAVIPAVENGYALGLDLNRLDEFRALGARYMTLTHNGHNQISDSAVPRKDLGDGPELHGGLSDFGRTVVARMNKLGMLVDISHVAKTAMLQAIDVSQTPVIATHSSVRAICDHPRNLDDEQMDRLAESGGLMQITLVSFFLKRGSKETEVTLSDYVDHIDYAVRHMGIAHVGIGTDFDGGGGVVGFRDASESAHLTAELIRRGYDTQAIAALWGGNFLRLLRMAEEKTTK